MALEKGRRLGRGLEALIPTGASKDESPTAGELIQVPVSRIRPNPYQPRRDFNEQDLADLQASISASGLLQPVTVRRAGDAYELIAGERRFRAVTRLGWTDVPAVVKDVDDRTLLTLALIENLQRADLNAIDEALGLKRLVDEFGFTHQQVAEAIGKDRTSVTNLLRMLTLPPEVQTLVESGKLSAGHARALLPLTRGGDATALANETIARQYSVRELEKRVRSHGQAGQAELGRPSKAPVPAPSSPPAVRHVEDGLRRHFQTDVKLRLTGAERGTVEIAFYSAEDLERLTDLMLGSDRDRY